MQTSSDRRPWTFYLLAAIFAAYVLFLYGPMFCIFVLSFQGPQGGLVFPMRGHGLFWFVQLVTQADTGDMIGAIGRSLPLALIVMVLTVVVSYRPGSRSASSFRGAGALFYLAVASLVAPGYVLGIGIGLMFEIFGISTDWYSSALGAQLTWTLPFGLLIMFAVFNRFNRAYEEAARDMGATPWQTLRLRGPADRRSRHDRAWRCSASRCPTTSSPARCRPRAATTRCRSRSGA